jgi:hypothetical protein
MVGVAAKMSKSACGKLHERRWGGSGHTGAWACHSEPRSRGKRLWTIGASRSCGRASANPIPAQKPFPVPGRMIRKLIECKRENLKRLRVCYTASQTSGTLGGRQNLDTELLYRAANS